MQRYNGIHVGKKFLLTNRLKRKFLEVRDTHLISFSANYHFFLIKTHDPSLLWWYLLLSTRWPVFFLTSRAYRLLNGKYELHELRSNISVPVGCCFWKWISHDRIAKDRSTQNYMTQDKWFVYFRGKIHSNAGFRLWWGP